MDETTADELTEFELIEVEAVKGVPKGANGFPHLIVKGVADPVAKGARDCPECGHSYDADSKATNCEDCGTKLPAAADASKASGDGGDCPTCDGTGKIRDGKVNCPDCDGTGNAPASKSAGPPQWHSPAAMLVRLAKESPGTPREDLFKAVNADGQVDEQPDIDGGMQAIALIGKLIGYEAGELAAGQLGETPDVQLLADAANLITIWLSRERAGQMAASDDTAISGGCVCGCGDGCFCCSDIVMASLAADGVAKADMSTADINDLKDSDFAYIEPGGKKDDEGKTTPRSLRHFPVHDKAHAQNALSRAPQSPFGDKAMPKIKAAAKKFGIDTDDASKSTVADGGTSVHTGGEDTGSLSKAVEDAVAKATAASEDRFKSVEERAAKAERRVDQLEELIKSTPVPGGPVLSAVRVNTRAEGRKDFWLAKAAEARQQAETVTDRQFADDSLRLARECEARAAAGTPIPTT